MYTREVVLPKALSDQPVVMVNCVDPAGGVTAVLPDEVAAGAAAADVLLRAGHRDGIHVVGERASPTVAGRERLEGLECAVHSAGVQLAGTIDCIWWPEGAYEAVGRFLAAGGRPGALVCLNDRVALGTYQALADAGLRVPADVSVVSFDDSELASWLRPPLTSVALPHRLLGRRGVELLLAGPAEPVVERMPMPVRERFSVGPPAARGCVASAG
jgi:LacI family transcriptional regulator